MAKLKNAFSFKGKAARPVFLRFIPIALIIWLVAGFIDEQFLAPNLCLINEAWECYLPGQVREGVTLDLIIACLLAIPFASILVRRMHDHGRSGWFALLVVPLILALIDWSYGLSGYEGNVGLILGVIIAFLPLFWLFTKSNNAK